MLLAIAGPAAAQQQPAGRWGVDWGTQHCTLSRSAPADAVVFAIRIIPGTDRPELLIATPGGGRPPLAAGDAVITLLPGAQRFAAEATLGRAERGQVVILGSLGLDYLASLASAEGLEVTQGSTVRARFAFPVARDAVAALQRCADNAMAEWGVDAARLATLRQWPQQERSWVTADDYPNEALRRSIAGTALARIAIDPAGRVTECTVVVSSGDTALDRASCASATTHGRYSPALGSDGAPVAVSFITDIRWSIRS